MKVDGKTGHLKGIVAPFFWQLILTYQRVSAFPNYI